MQRASIKRWTYRTGGKAYLSALKARRYRATRAWRTRRAGPRASRGEVKYADNYIADAIIPLLGTPFTFTEINAAFVGFSNLIVPQNGTTVNDRVGDKLTVINYKMDFDISAQSTTVNAPIRVLLIYDKSPNGVAPIVTDILNESGRGLTFQAGINNSNKDRFIVLGDRTVMIAQGGGIVRHVRWNKRKRLVMKFRVNTGG